MKKIILCSLLAGGLSFLPHSAKSQLEAGNYSFTALSGTYTPLVGGTVLSSIQTDDQLSVPIAIGFPFLFEGVSFDSVRVSSNGWLTFNYTSGTTASTIGNDLDFSAAAIRPLVAPLWDDLDGSAAGGSQASYLVTGTAPNRVFTFEWAGWEWNYQASDSVLSFQVKLYETTNVIELVYKQEFDAVSSPSASIGIAGVNTGTGNFLSLNSTGTSPSASSISETTSLSTKPATGQVYRFSPPVFFPLDIGALVVIPPVFDGCYTTTETVKVVVKNRGTSAINFATNNVTFGARVTGPNATTLSAVLNSGTLASFAQDTFTATTTYNMSASGTYGFKGYAVVSGDGNTMNDSASTTEMVTVASPVAFQSGCDFTGFTGANLTSVFPLWREGNGTLPNGTASGWRSKTGLGTSGNVNAALNLYNTAHKEWLVSSQFTVVENSALTYKVAVTDWLSTTSSDVMGSDDKLYAMISTDCGYSWTKIDSVTAADNLTIDLVQRSVDLTSFAGMKVYVAFLAQDGPVDDSEDYDINLDDIDIRQIDLLNPADGTVLTIEGLGTNLVEANWSTAHILSGSVTYKWLLDAAGNSFAAPLMMAPSDNSGMDTAITFDYTTVDGLVAGLGLNVGDSADLIWTARGYNGTDSTQAKEAFNLRIKRGSLLEAFNLVSPSNGTVINIEKDASTPVTATWEKGADSSNYVWILETLAGLPLAAMPTGRDTMMTLTYGDIDALLTAAPIGTTVNLRWTVGSIIGNDTMFADNGYFTLDVVRGALTGSFNLLTPATGHAVTIEGAQTQIVSFTWEDAQTNGNGDITYTWMLDYASGDFTSPLMSMASNSSGVDEALDVDYDALAVVLRDENIAFGSVMNAKWIVMDNLGDTAVAPFNIDLKRGVMTGIENAGNTDVQIRVFPNPSNGQFRLTASGVKGETMFVTVYDITGQQVLSDRIAMSNGQAVQNYDLGNNGSGIYLIKMNSGDFTRTIRMVINE